RYAPKFFHVVGHLVREWVGEDGSKDEAGNRAVCDWRPIAPVSDGAERVMEHVPGIRAVKDAVAAPPRDVPPTPADREPRHVDADVAALLAEIADQLERVPSDSAAQVDEGHARRQPDVLVVPLDVPLSDLSQAVRPGPCQRDEVARDVEPFEAMEPVDRRNAN